MRIGFLIGFGFWYTELPWADGFRGGLKDGPLLLLLLLFFFEFLILGVHSIFEERKHSTPLNSTYEVKYDTKPASPL
jgi:hypothetical protein